MQNYKLSGNRPSLFPNLMVPNPQELLLCSFCDSPEPDASPVFYEGGDLVHWQVLPDSLYSG